MGQKLLKEFYLRDDVITIARDLLGKILIRNLHGVLTSGIIIETEAYHPEDRASHAFMRRKTKRNSVMFEEGGVAYVFMNYGIHFLFNVVTNIKEEPDAVLIRSLQPVSGIETMKSRRNKITDSRITSGPGALSKAMAIDLSLNGESLSGDLIWIEEYQSALPDNSQIISTKRIGIDYAGEHASYPWRFYFKNNPWISKP
jgi:DNA-3-methyladenine glycosylase